MWGVEMSGCGQLGRKGLCLGKTSVGTANLGLAVPGGRGPAELFLEPVPQGWLCGLLTCVRTAFTGSGCEPLLCHSLA